MKHSILNKNDSIMVPDIDTWTIFPYRNSISLPLSKKSLRYRVAMRGKNGDIEGFCFCFEYKPLISGLILQDMQIWNIGPDIEGFFFDIEYQPSLSKAHDDDIE